MSVFGSEYAELKKSGMSPEQIMKALDEKKAAEDRATALEAELATQKTTLTTMEGSFNEVKAKLAELEANPPKRVETKVEDGKQPFTSYLDNEDQAFDDRFKDRVLPIAQVALKSAANSAKLLAMQQLVGRFTNTAGGRISHKALWDKWQGEIEKQSEMVPIATLGNASTWINIFDYVLGKHFNDLMSEPQTFVESVETRTDRKVGGESEKKDDKLNAEELGAVGKMAKYSKGLTADRYAEIKKKMKFVGDNA